jgi:hypothetical protein
MPLWLSVVVAVVAVVLGTGVVAWLIEKRVCSRDARKSIT